MSKASRAKDSTASDLAAVSDNPEWTRDDFRKARKFADVFPDLVASIKRGRGPNKMPTKKLVTLRLSAAVVDHFKAMGPGWQTRIDETLQQAVRQRSSGTKKRASV